MIKIIVIFTAILTLVGILYGVAVGVNIVHADEANTHSLHNPSNAHEVIYGYSIIADDFYSQNGNYDIQFDGTTCMRWIREDMPVVIANPTTITYSDPIDDFDLLNIIACEA